MRRRNRSNPLPGMGAASETTETDDGKGRLGIDSGAVVADHASETMNTDDGKGRLMNEGGTDGDRDKAAGAVRGGVRRAELRLPSRDLHADLSFFGEMLGFRLDSIFPADDPAVAVMSGHGLRLRLSHGGDEAPGAIRLLCDDPAGFAGGECDLVAPNGTRIEIRPAAAPAPEMPPIRHALLVQRSDDSGSWGVGRAGMHYRDLIPGRLGGSVIASHIRIPDGGPVPDMVHYHIALFQLIYCYRGWVRVVYEDQGPPFALAAGDCLIQPPEIRHRVLESSANAEVIELAVPARHPTMIDHALTLPTDVHDPERDFGGQRFCRHRRSGAVWGEWRLPGFEACGTGIAAATGGVANARVARRAVGSAGGGDDAVPAVSHDAGVAGSRGEGFVTSHDADVLFTFVLEGRMTLRTRGREAEDLSAGAAFVLPPGTKAAYTRCSDDLELLEVSLPGAFETTTHESL